MQPRGASIKPQAESAMEPGLRNSLLSSSTAADGRPDTLAISDNNRVSDDGEDRRIHARRRVVWKASIQCSHHNFDCQIHDLSMTGARIKLDVPLASNYGIVLSIPGIAPLTARTVWYSNGLLGIEFIGKLNYIESQLAKRLTTSRLSDWK